MSPATGRIAAAPPAPVPADVLAALLPLNHHARAYGCGKRAIYAYKTLVAALLVAAGETRAQLVQWTGKCGHCGGTERYVDSYGERWPHCRQCSSTGTVTLKFVETVLPCGQAWHHPWDRYDDGGRELAEIAGLAVWDGERGRYRAAGGGDPIFSNIASDWRPQRPSFSLDADAAAEALNVVEAWLLLSVANVLPTPLHFLRERALRDMRAYIIDIGRVGSKCWYCASEDVTSGLARYGPPFSWSAPVCRVHHRVELALWPAKTDLPESALTPALPEWGARHTRLGFCFEGLKVPG